jgi:phosphate transport system permease protein
MSHAKTPNVVEMRKRIALNKTRDYIFWVIGLLSTLIGFVLLFTMIIDLFIDGFPRLSGQFLLSYPSRFPEKAGILSAWVGTTLVMIVTAATAVPLGIGAGIYLEEYRRKNWLTHLIEINMNNLAGVPSIIYGLLALGVFVYFLKFGESILTGGLTLGLLILPMVVIATRESIRAIPNSIREASYALGATKWQTVYHVVLPAARSGILASFILGMGRAIGETMAVIMVAGNALKIPTSLTDPLRTLTSNIALELAYATGDHRSALFSTGVVLLVIIMFLNLVANFWVKKRAAK